MNALKPEPGFQVLIMSEESRLGREQIETAYALKQIMDAGVRVCFYLRRGGPSTPRPSPETRRAGSAGARRRSMASRRIFSPASPCAPSAAARWVGSPNSTGRDPRLVVDG
jgi:hypothetical protein